MHQPFIVHAWQLNLCLLIVCNSNIVWKSVKLQVDSPMSIRVCVCECVHLCDVFVRVTGCDWKRVEV